MDERSFVLEMFNELEGRFGDEKNEAVGESPVDPICCDGERFLVAEEADGRPEPRHALQYRIDTALQRLR